MAGLLLVDPSGDFGRVPAEQTDPFLAALDSEAYAATIGRYWESILTGADPAGRERVMADLWATPKETVVGFFRVWRGYDPLPALRSYGGPMLSVVTPINDEPISLHNLGTCLPHATFAGTGHWLHIDEPERFNGILDGFLARTPWTVHA